MKLFYLFITILILGTSTLSAQNCNSSLTVKKDRNTRYVDADGTSYTLVLKNKSTNYVSYDLGYSDTNSCNRHSEKRFISDLPLKVTFYNIDQLKTSISSIKLAPNSEKEIVVKLEKTKGSTSNSWTCLNVHAKSMSCKKNESTVTLQAYISDNTDR